MIAAIYARKSTDQKVADDSKAVNIQVEEARKFAAQQGWTVPAQFEFMDDGMSGAEFERRPAFTKLRDLLKGRAPFQKLIVSERKSLGREMSETSYVIKQLDQAGVEVYEYVHGESLTPRDHLAKLMSSVQGFSDEDHQRKTSERVMVVHARLAKGGRVTGGRVFGYKNVHKFNGEDASGNPLKSHTEREIVPSEAATVTHIYELYASGLGLKSIAKRMRQEGWIPPKPFVRKSDRIPTPIGDWAPSTIRTILTREIYKGLLVWNKTKKRNAWGKADPKPRPESEWVTTEVEHLRIVSNDLWASCASRRKDVAGKTVRFEGGRLSGRPPRNGVLNLLAGLATCGTCGGGLVVETSGRKKGRVAEYVCHRHRVSGTCTNALRIPVFEMNEEVLQAVEEHALTPEAIEQVILLTERDDVRDAQATLDLERVDMQKRIARIVDAIAVGGQMAALVNQLRELEARQVAIEDEIRGLHPVPRLAPQVIEDRLAEWRRLLRASTTTGRTVLQRVLLGRLTFIPRADKAGYDFSGPTRFDRLFTGLVINAPDRPSFIDPTDRTGTESIGPADTGEADYGRLLEAAFFRKGWRPRGDSNP